MSIELMCFQMQNQSVCPKPRPTIVTSVCLYLRLLV